PTGDAGDSNEVGSDCGAHGVSVSPIRTSERLYPSPVRRNCHRCIFPERRYWPTLSQRGGTMRLSIVLPAKNEAEGLARTLPGLRALYPDAEVIVVDDGSTDATAQVAADHG